MNTLPCLTNGWLQYESNVKHEKDHNKSMRTIRNAEPNACCGHAQCHYAMWQMNRYVISISHFETAVSELWKLHIWWWAQSPSITYRCAEWTPLADHYCLFIVKTKKLGPVDHEKAHALSTFKFNHGWYCRVFTLCASILSSNPNGWA